MSPRIPPEGTACNATGDATSDRIRGAKVGPERLGEHRQRHRLEPDLAGPDELHQPMTITTRPAIDDPRYPCHLELNRLSERANVARVNQQLLALGELIVDHLAPEFDPCRTMSFEPLEDEPLLPEERPTERLLEGHGSDDIARPTDPAIAMHEVGLPLRDLERNDVTGELGTEGDESRSARGLEVREQQTPPPATRFNAPIKPPPAAPVVWVMRTLADIHDSSPRSLTRWSPGSRTISSTGIVEPLMDACTPASFRHAVAKRTTGRLADPGTGPRGHTWRRLVEVADVDLCGGAGSTGRYSGELGSTWTATVPRGTIPSSCSARCS